MYVLHYLFERYLSMITPDSPPVNQEQHICISDCLSLCLNNTQLMIESWWLISFCSTSLSLYNLENKLPQLARILNTCCAHFLIYIQARMT